MDEDEADARKAGAASREWRFDESRPTAAIVADDSPRWESYLGSGVWDCDDPYDDCEDARREARDEAEHIARWDPARVLAEIAAKRAILDEYERLRDVAIADDDKGAAVMAVGLHVALRLHAQPHTEHADFDPTWRT